MYEAALQRELQQLLILEICRTNRRLKFKKLSCVWWACPAARRVHKAPTSELVIVSVGAYCCAEIHPNTQIRSHVSWCALPPNERSTVTTARNFSAPLLILLSLPPGFLDDHQVHTSTRHAPPSEALQLLPTGGRTQTEIYPALPVVHIRSLVGRTSLLLVAPPMLRGP